MTIRRDFGEDDNIDAGVRHSVVGKMMIGMMVDRSIGKSILLQEVDEQGVTLVVVSGGDGGIGVPSYEN